MDLFEKGYLKGTKIEEELFEKKGPDNEIVVL